MKTWTTKSAQETKDISAQVLQSLIEANANTLLLKGDLGAGKTTFMQGLGQVLGIKDIIISPTFVLMKQYKTNHSIFKHLIHVDAYRLEHPDEILVLEWNHIISQPDTLICIEWPDLLGSHTPNKSLKLNLTWIDENHRKLKLFK